MAARQEPAHKKSQAKTKRKEERGDPDKERAMCKYKGAGG
jgi:hypothetical protein